MKNLLGTTNNPSAFLKDHFTSEKDMCDYIELNIHLFCQQCLGMSYGSHRREYPLDSYGRKARRVDFLIRSESNQVALVEVKRPKYISELHCAVGQILNYGTVYKAMRGQFPFKLALVSNKYCTEILMMKEDYNLPITFIGLDKDHHLLNDVSHLQS